jgi:glycosyltransferase involved in cell wall biosynthesis
LLEQVESIIQQPISWVDSEIKTSWKNLGLEVPDVFFQSGWHSKAFMTLGKEVNRAGGRVICFADNRWKNTPKQWLGSLHFRMSLKQKFYGVWVPGASGYRLFRFFGVPEQRIYKNLYAADNSVFYPGPPLFQREKKILFVGQLIERKGISLLLKAFSRFHQEYPEWELGIVGAGPLEISSELPGVTLEGFQPPDDISRLMRESRFLVLPSLDEHWGLVVHEAALSGCGLIVSDSVGSAFDLVSSANGLICKTNSVDSLYSRFVQAASWDDLKLDLAFTESLNKASEFSTEAWSNQLQTILNDICGNRSSTLMSFLK